MEKKNNLQQGLVGWLDLLGYKSIMKNNPLSEAVKIVETVQNVIEDAGKRLSKSQEIADEKFCDYVLFSDTILLYCKGAEHLNAGFLTEFSADLVSNLFWAGLPVRGAWAFGDFYVESGPAKISIAGLPIVEAHEFADRLQLVGCVLAPSAEIALVRKGVLDSSVKQSLGFIRHLVPLKQLQKQEMFMVNHYAIDLHYNRERQISRQKILEQFSAHGKQIEVEVLPKIENTLEFLRKSKPSAEHLPAD